MQRQHPRGGIWRHWTRYPAFCCFLALTVGTPLRGFAQLIPDSALQLYAVKVIKTPPFQKPVTGYGIYLGSGLVLTAAHVVGHWPVFTHPHVVIAGQDLPASIVKKGTFETTDLALLSVDQTRLPVSLRLRRNPLCSGPLRIGMPVVDVLPQTTFRSRIISPLLIPPALQHRFDSLIDTPKESGSGIFDPERQCLLGIVSAKVMKFAYRKLNGRVIWSSSGFAGYFVPASKIVTFLPPGLHY